MPVSAGAYSSACLRPGKRLTQLNVSSFRENTERWTEPGHRMNQETPEVQNCWICLNNTMLAGTKSLP